MTAWADAAMGLLADGDWHDLDSVVEVASPVIPPGVAYRNGERMRHNQGTADGRTRGDEATSIAVGARRIVYEVLQRRCRYGAVERRHIAGGVQFRIAARRKAA